MSLPILARSTVLLGLVTTGAAAILSAAQQQPTGGGTNNFTDKIAVTGAEYAGRKLR